MKYIVDTQTNVNFLQIFGVTENNKQMEYPFACQPFACQVRGGELMRKKLKDALKETQKRIKRNAKKYHEDENAREEYENGFSIFKSGEIPIHVLCKQNYITVIIGYTQIGNGPLSDIQNLIDSL